MYTCAVQSILRCTTQWFTSNTSYFVTRNILLERRVWARDRRPVPVWAADARTSARTESTEHGTQRARSTPSDTLTHVARLGYGRGTSCAGHPVVRRRPVARRRRRRPPARHRRDPLTIPRVRRIPSCTRTDGERDR